MALSYPIARIEPNLYSVYHYTSIRNVVGPLESPQHTIWNSLQVNPRTFQVPAGDHMSQVLAHVPILRRAMPKRGTRSEDTSLFSFCGATRETQHRAELGNEPCFLGLTETHHWAEFGNEPRFRGLTG